MRIRGRKLETAKRLWKKDKQIAEELGLQVSTVKAYIREILLITDASTRTEAFLRLIDSKYFTTEEALECS